MSDKLDFCAVKNRPKRKLHKITAPHVSETIEKTYAVSSKEETKWVIDARQIFGKETGKIYTSYYLGFNLFGYFRRDDLNSDIEWIHIDLQVTNEKDEPFIKECQTDYKLISASQSDF